MLPAVPTSVRGVMFEFCSVVAGWGWVAFANSFCFASFEKIIESKQNVFAKMGERFSCQC